MNIHISITCDECLKDDYVILTKDDNTNEYSITESIEYQSFYWCNHDKADGFKLNCTCGNDVLIRI